MKKLILLLIPIIFFANIVSAKAYDVKLYFFHGDGCPHCAEEEEYLEELEEKYRTSEDKKEKIQLAIEAGKYFTEELMENTNDNTGLIEKV